MRGPNQVTSKSDVVAFINTASRRLTERRPDGSARGVRSGHVQMSSPANAVESGTACGRALPLQELVGQSFFISHRRAGHAGVADRPDGRTNEERRGDSHANSPFTCADSSVDNIYQITVRYTLDVLATARRQSEVDLPQSLSHHAPSSTQYSSPRCSNMYTE